MTKSTRKPKRRGVASPAAVILLTSILVLGCIVGLVTMRDHLVQQFGDVAVALDRLDQSYFYRIGIDGNQDGDLEDPADCILAGQFVDGPVLVDVVDAAPACLSLEQSPVDEG